MTPKLAAALAARMNVTNYWCYYSELRVTNYTGSGGLLVLSCPHQFILDHLETYRMDTLAAAIHDAYDPHTAVRLELDRSLPCNCDVDREAV